MCLVCIYSRRSDERVDSCSKRCRSKTASCSNIKRVECSVKVTAYEMIFRNLNYFGFDSRANLHSFETSGMKKTPRWRIHRTWSITFENYSFSLPIRAAGYCRKKRLCIGMEGRSVQFFGFGKLNDFSEVHNGYSVAEIVHDVQVMRNEEIS